MIYILNTFSVVAAAAAAVVWAFEHIGEALTLGGFSLPRVSFITPHVADVLMEQTVSKEGIP